MIIFMQHTTKLQARSHKEIPSLFDEEEIECPPQVPQEPSLQMDSLAVTYVRPPYERKLWIPLQRIIAQGGTTISQDYHVGGECL